jgi:hypothetical protein
VIFGAVKYGRCKHYDEDAGEGYVVVGILCIIVFGLILLFSSTGYNTADVRARSINSHVWRYLMKVTTDDCFYSWDEVKKQLNIKDDSDNKVDK